MEQVNNNQEQRPETNDDINNQDEQSKQKEEEEEEKKQSENLFPISKTSGESIKVAVRIRPLNKLERKKNELNCTEYNLQEKTVSIGANGPPSATGMTDYRSHTFSFDHIFPPHVTNEDVYNSLCTPILNSAFNGIHGAVLCYGQTGAGKTYTMFGNDDDHINNKKKNVVIKKNNNNDDLTTLNEDSDRDNNNNETKEQKYDNDINYSNADIGIIPRMLTDLFQKINLAGKDLYQFDVRMTVLEIYQNKIYDLISGSKNPCTLIGGANNTPGTKKNKFVSKIKRAGISVDGATEVQIQYANAALQIIKDAQKNRMTHETKMNSTSSRSHCIVIVSIAKSDLTTQTTTLGQLYLVDLAGSEKVSKTGAMGMRLDEAKQINTSLLTLGIVIDKLISKARHVPYRDSNLTRLLQNCLGGNARCALCVNISPSSWHYGESMSTLYFGCRTRTIKNKPKSNKFLSATQLQENLRKYNKQIQMNRQILSKLENELGDVKEFFDIIRNGNDRNSASSLMCDLLCTQRVNMRRPQGVKQYKLYTSSSDSDSGDDVVGDDDNDEVKRSMK